MEIDNAQPKSDNDHLKIDNIHLVHKKSKSKDSHHLKHTSLHKLLKRARKFEAILQLMIKIEKEKHLH